jgi:hypothetical protein
VRATSKRLSNMAEGRLRLTRVRAARFGHHIAFGLSETFDGGFPLTPAWVLSQWAPRRHEFEERGGVEPGVTIDEAVAAIGHTDDTDSMLGFEPGAVAAYGSG